jgi:hypothetical protein
MEVKSGLIEIKDTITKILIFPILIILDMMGGDVFSND